MTRAATREPVPGGFGRPSGRVEASASFARYASRRHGWDARIIELHR
jgi:hypothetical protein